MRTDMLHQLEGVVRRAGDIVREAHDIERATKIARAMVCHYGFSEKLGPMIYGSDQEEVFLGRDLGRRRTFWARRGITRP